MLSRTIQGNKAAKRNRGKANLEALESRLHFASAPFHVFPAIGQSTNFLQNLTAGPDGNVYFSSGLNNQVASITPTGVVKVYNTTAVSPHGPTSVVTGPDGNVWFDELFAAVVGKVTLSSGAVSGLKLSQTIPAPSNMTLGPDGNFWIDSFDSDISRVTPAGVATNFSYSGSGSGKIVSFNHALYFSSGNEIREISTAGSFGAAYTAPDGGTFQDIKVGADGNLWFTETAKSSTDANNYFGYLTPAGVVKQFTVSAADGALTGITMGADGNIYFRAGDNLVGATTAGSVFVVESLGSGSSTSSTDLITGPDGNLWFNEGFNDEIGVAYVAGSISGAVTNSVTKVGIPNVTLFIDAKHTGSYAAGDPTTVTNSAGSYHFNVVAGSYVVGVEAPSGYTISGLAKSTVTVTVGKTSTANFQLTQTSGAPLVGLTDLDATAAEGIYGSPPSTGLIALNRESGGTGAVTVNLSLGGAAVYGVDYKFTVTGGSYTYNATTKVLSITLAAGVKGAAIVITPQTVAASEAAEAVTLTLLSSSAYSLDPTRLTATVTIAAH